MGHGRPAREPPYMYRCKNKKGIWFSNFCEVCRKQDFFIKHFIAKVKDGNCERLHVKKLENTTTNLINLLIMSSIKEVIDKAPN